MTTQLRCYGRRAGREADCPTCEARTECGKASDPALIGILDYDGSEPEAPAAEVDPDGMDDTPPAEPPAGSSIETEVAARLREAIALIMGACDWSPVRIATAWGRVAGLSFSQIGARLGVSKQACRQQIDAIAGRNLALAEYLSGLPVQIEAARGVDLDVLKLEAEEARTLLEKSAWLKRKN